MLNKEYETRMKIMLLTAAVVFLVLLSRLAYLQLYKGAYYGKQAGYDQNPGFYLVSDGGTKPYRMRELVARMRAVMRRVSTERGSTPTEIDGSVLEVGDVSLDPDEHIVRVRGEHIQMPLKEFELLHLLLANAGRVLARETLIDRVWGIDYVGDTKTLDVHIKRLRAKIEDEPSDPKRIVTIRGLGYKFERSR